MSRPVTVRIYSPYFPYPITEGAFQVAFDQARSLSEMGYDVELVSWKDSASTIARKLSAGARPFPESIRITSLYGGAPTTATALEWSARAVDPARPVGRESRVARLARVIRSLASPLASPETFYFPPTAADVRAALPPADLGIYHYSFAYSWLRNGAPERRTAVHFLNLESELSRLQGRVAAAGGTRWIHRMNARKLERHEAELADLADELWFVSRRDLAHLAATRPTVTARHVAPTFELALLRRRGHHAANLAGMDRSVSLGFIGGCHFEPNRASLEWIVTRLAPELERRSFAGRILVVGRGVPDRLREAGARYPFFDWLGFVPDVEEFWGRIAFLLMPEVGGSGVRIKLLEAMASGVPVIANSAALQALSRDAAEHPLVNRLDDAAAWAELIVREGAPRESRERLAEHDMTGTDLDACVAYRFLPELVGDPLVVDAR